MKARTFLSFYLTFFILAIAGIGLYQNQEMPKYMEIIHISMLVIIIGIGLYQAYQKILSKKKEQPSDDELSLKILYRASSTSYLVSLYLWALIIYIWSKTETGIGILFGSGILTMAAIFVLCWLYYKLFGINDA